MQNEKINIKNKFKEFSDHWSPKIIAELNDYQFKIARIKGEFVWHRHDETDEAFIVIDGSMEIKFRDKKILLERGDLFVVPRGTDHKPYAKGECKIMLIEPKGVINTGSLVNNFTKQKEEWV